MFSEFPWLFQGAILEVMCFTASAFAKKNPHGRLSLYACFLKWQYPQNTPKWSCLVGKPIAVGETHHVRKAPYHNKCNHRQPARTQVTPIIFEAHGGDGWNPHASLSTRLHPTRSSCYLFA